MPERPTSVSVLAIITIVLACAGLGCIPISVFSTLYNTENPGYFIVEESTFFRFWVIGTSALGWIASLAAIAGGVGAWMMKPWGRTTLLGYAIYSIVMAVLGTLVSLFFFVMPLMEHVDMESDMGPAILGGAIGGMCGGLCGGLILPICLLYFLTRPHVVAAFAQAEAASA